MITRTFYRARHQCPSSRNEQLLRSFHRGVFAVIVKVLAPFLTFFAASIPGVCAAPCETAKIVAGSATPISGNALEGIRYDRR
jgi:hypothetical protein